MNDFPFDPAPGFDQPVAVLRHCHDRIRKQLRTLDKLVEHLSSNGQNVDVQQAAAAVLRYFEKSAPQHHADEEEDLLPMLEATATGDDAVLLQALTPQIESEHEEMDGAWSRLAPRLRELAAGEASALPADEVGAFTTMYRAHMELEESRVAPMALRLFPAEQMARLGDAMRARRGIAC
jgi:hemerythrin-like domain-containing protein